VPPIVLTLVQGLLLVLLYWFVARAVRAVIRDLRATSAAAASSPPRREASAGRPSKRSGGGRDAVRAAPSQLVVHQPDAKPEVVVLDSHDVTFGRAEASTVVLSDPYTSDHHARVYLTDGRWLVTDLGSTNGTYLNQVKLTAPAEIAAGDQLAVGKTVVQVRR
jgi:pSer/pThr/pTyr-binding forkhead associated (FHA) protein